MFMSKISNLQTRTSEPCKIPPTLSISFKSYLALVRQRKKKNKYGYNITLEQFRKVIEYFQTDTKLLLLRFSSYHAKILLIESFNHSLHHSSSARCAADLLRRHCRPPVDVTHTAKRRGFKRLKVSSSLDDKSRGCQCNGVTRQTQHAGSASVGCGCH